jgi:hypothetical protein
MSLHTCLSVICMRLYGGSYGKPFAQSWVECWLCCVMNSKIIRPVRMRSCLLPSLCMPTSHTASIRLWNRPRLIFLPIYLRQSRICVVYFVVNQWKLLWYTWKSPLGTELRSSLFLIIKGIYFVFALRQNSSKTCLNSGETPALPSLLGTWNSLQGYLPFRQVHSLITRC